VRRAVGCASAAKAITAISSERRGEVGKAVEDIGRDWRLRGEEERIERIERIERRE